MAELREPATDDGDDPLVLNAQWLEYRIVGDEPEATFRLSDGENEVDLDADFGRPERNARKLADIGYALVLFAEKVRLRERQKLGTYVFTVPPGSLSGPG